jgi:hypothetical protein
VTRASIEAHMTVCSDCRALLEVERDIRTRAGEVLADVSLPAVDAPPFAALQQSAVGTRRPVRAVPLAWAASVVLALGAGWWGSDIYRTGLRDDARSMIAAPSSSEVEASAQESAAAADGAGTVAESPREDVRGPQQLRTTPAAPAPQAASGSASDTRVANRGPGGGFSQGTARTDQAAAAAAPPPGQATLGDAARDLSRRAAAAAGDTVVRAPERAQAATPPPAAALPKTESAGVPLPAPMQFLPGRAGQRTTIDDNNLAIFNDQLAQLDRGLVLMRDTTDALHDWPLLRIEGGDVPEIERGNAIGTEFVRVRQRVAGAVVELVFWRTMPLALQELVVTGVQKQLTDSQARQQVQNQAATSERRAANERTFITARDSSAGIGYRAVLSNSVLPDGRQQMVLRLTDAPVLLAIRGYLTPAELAELSSRLVPLRND